MRECAHEATGERELALTQNTVVVQIADLKDRGGEKLSKKDRVWGADPLDKFRQVNISGVIFVNYSKTLRKSI